MEKRSGGSCVLQKHLKVLNQKEDQDLQHKLNMLDRQYRYTRKMLQQRRVSLKSEQKRVVMVKVCEPKAIVNIAMKEIWEHRNTETHFREIQRSFSCKSNYDVKSPKRVEKSRSISAPPTTAIKASTSLRHRGRVQSSLSLMQMKDIAKIDSISEKEHARRQQEALEEAERLRRLQREALQKRVAAFIEKLKDKSNMEILEPP